MSLLQNKLSRRTVLKGLGAAVALPWLEAMRPAVSLAAAGGAKAVPTRMAFLFVPNGVIVPAWTPEGEGRDFKFGETMQSLAAFKNDLNVISGLAQDEGRAKGDGPGDHARCASTYLTGAHPVKTSGADIRVGISVDQVAAEQVGKLTRLPSLELGIERGRTSGNCDSGYSCAYSSAISWKTPSTPMAKEINPRQAFERLFGDADGARGRAERDFYRKSILDVVADDAAKLKTKLGRTDRAKIDEYFTSVRELEQRIERLGEVAVVDPPDFEAPEETPENAEEHIRLMLDLLVLAFRTDSTRIATFMLGNAGSNRSYSMVGVNSGHHQLSHHRNDEDKINDIKKIDKFLMSQFAYLLKQLKETKEGSGSLLDHSMIVYGSGLSDGNRHNHDELPIILAGRGNGTIKTSRHIRYQSETPLNNLFMSLLDRMNAPVETFGDSTGQLKEIDA